jgi:hypothetical protein
MMFEGKMDRGRALALLQPTLTGKGNHTKIEGKLLYDFSLSSSKIGEFV